MMVPLLVERVSARPPPSVLELFRQTGSRPRLSRALLTWRGRTEGRATVRADDTQTHRRTNGPGRGGRAAAAEPAKPGKPSAAWHKNQIGVDPLKKITLEYGVTQSKRTARRTPLYPDLPFIRLLPSGDPSGRVPKNRVMRWRADSGTFPFP